MVLIDFVQFQRIVATHGEIEGAVYFDTEESLTHELFPDCIVFQTNYLDSRSYEVSFADTELSVRKTRLDNYQRGHKAQVIDDAMDDEDWEELGNLWQRLSRDLDPHGQQAQPDLSNSLAELFYYLCDEAHAETLVQNLPAPTQQWDWAWSQIESALTEAKLLTEFEWKDWSSYGVHAVNSLAPLRQRGIEITAPDSKTIATVNNAGNWERALLQYFNAQLEAYDLKLLAIGTHFDERQSFACLRMNGLNLANALEILGRLGIVHKY